MKMAYAGLVALALMGSATGAGAQEPGARAQGGPRMGGGAMLLQGITLTPEQQVKADSINKKYADQRMALREDQSLDMEARRSKGRELMMKQQDEIKAILTDEQKKVFEKNLAEMQARMPGGGGRPPR